MVPDSKNKKRHRARFSYLTTFSLLKEKLPMTFCNATCNIRPWSHSKDVARYHARSPGKSI